MAYLTTEDMYTHIYQENIETICRGDEAVMLSAIDAAIEEASGYLTKYDTQTIFPQQAAHETLSCCCS